MAIKSTITGSTAINATINKPDTVKTTSAVLQQSRASLGLNNVTNESKETMFNSPTFTGTVSGVTATHVGLGNVTNESKATMFTSAALTGTPTTPTAAAGTDTTQIASTAFVNTAIANNSPNYEEINVTNINVSGTATGISKSMVGLGDVDNESKSTMFTSAALTGTPTAPTASAATNSTQVATTEYTTTAISNLVGSAPATLNTLNEIAEALNDSPAQIDNILSAVGQRLVIGNNLSDLNNAGTARTNLELGNVTNESKSTMFTNPTFTGTVSGVTATHVGLGNVTNESKATMFTGAALTGTPTAPTAGAGTNTTQIATTAFVTTAISNNSPNYEELNVTNINVSGTATGISKSMVGLGNVDNTSDANKPVSTATQTALNLKANIADPTFTGTVSGVTATHVGLGNVTNESKATMFSNPTFTGNVDLSRIAGANNITIQPDNRSAGGYDVTIQGGRSNNSIGGNVNIQAGTEGSEGTGPGDINIGTDEIDRITIGTNSASYTVNNNSAFRTAIGLGNVTNESKATMFSNPTFTGTVSGVTATHVGLGNVTNESKSTMFTDPTFTGDVSVADKIVHTGDTNTAIRFPSNDTITFETAGAERMRIASDGDIGIGTSAPATGFHVDVNDRVRFENSSGDSIVQITSSSEQVEVLQFGESSSFYNNAYIRTDYDSGNFIISGSGNSAIEDLQITNGTDDVEIVGGTIKLNTTDVAINDKITHIGDTNTAIRFPSNDVIAFETAGSERARIYNNSNISIFQVNSGGSGAAAHVIINGIKTNDSEIGTLTFYNDGDSVAQVRADRAGANSAADLVFTTQPSGGSVTERMRISSTGDIIIADNKNIVLGSDSPESAATINNLYLGASSTKTANSSILIGNPKDFGETVKSMTSRLGTQNTIIGSGLRLDPIFNQTAYGNPISSSGNTIIGHGHHLNYISYPQTAHNTLIGIDNISNASYQKCAVGIGRGCTVSGGAVGIGENTTSGGSNSYGPYGGGVAIGYRASASRDGVAIGGYITDAGSNAIAIGSNSAQFSQRCQAAGGSSIAIGQGTLTHSGASAAIAIGQYANANNTNADRGVAIGAYSDVTAADTVAIGMNSQSTAVSAIAIGHNTDATVQKAIAIGADAQATGAQAIAVGDRANVSATRGVAIGYRSDQDGIDSVVVGHRVKNTVSSVAEIGYWSDASTRGGAVRINGGTGQVSATIQNRSSAYTDGGATKGSEADNTLMREGYSFRRDSSNLFLDLNVGGTVTTKDIGPFADDLATLKLSVQDKSADYTLVASDTGTLINGTAATFDALSITSDLGAGFSCTVLNPNADVIITASNSMSINGTSNGSVTLQQGYQPATIVRIASNSYAIFGNLS